MKIAEYWSRESLMDAVMTNAPADEPMALSLSRLAAAIRWDAEHGLRGAPRDDDEPPITYNALTVHYAYTHHPTLSKPFNKVRRNTDVRRRNR